MLRMFVVAAASPNDFRLERRPNAKWTELPGVHVRSMLFVWSVILPNSLEKRANYQRESHSSSAISSRNYECAGAGVIKFECERARAHMCVSVDYRARPCKIKFVEIQLVFCYGSLCSRDDGSVGDWMSFRVAVPLISVFIVCAAL